MSSKSKIHQIGLILLIISFCFITSGIFIGYTSSSKRITSLAMKNLATSLSLLTKDIYEEQKEKINTDFTLNSTMKINATSSYLTNKIQENKNLLPYTNLLRNLSNMENSINLVHDNTNKKLLLTFSSKAYKSPYIDRKYLIQNTTLYHYNPDLRPNYINKGNNSYFEDVSLEKNNLKYIYSKIIESLKNNLTEDYFITTKEELTNNNEKQVVNKVSIIINNQILKELIFAILSDLEKDKTTSYIINAINQETNFIENLTNNKILEKEEKIIFNIYTNKYGTENLKYELKLINSNNKIVIIYNLKNNYGQIIKDNNILINYQIIKNNFNTRIDFISKDNKQLGNLIYRKLKNKKEFQMNYDDSKHNILGNYIYEKINLVEKTEIIIHKFNLHITNTKEEIINIDSEINSKILPTAKIEEDVSTSVFSSSITQEEKDLYLSNFKEKINKIYQ